jgi:anti-anti-sigma regulatory factor
MAGKKGGSVIGFDPLAWMKEPGTESGVERATPRTARANHDGASREANTDSATDASPAVNPDDRRAGSAPIGTARLGEVLTIEQAASMHAELGRHLAAESVVLEAGALQRIDAAGLQLLAAFVRAADARGTRVSWRALPSVLRDGARRLGLTGVLHLD